jgi:hypothetical protein
MNIRPSHRRFTRAVAMIAMTTAFIQPRRPGGRWEGRGVYRLQAARQRTGERHSDPRHQYSAQVQGLPAATRRI